MTDAAWGHAMLRERSQKSSAVHDLFHPQRAKSYRAFVLDHIQNLELFVNCVKCF